jgi:hypothetical protein
MTSDENLDDEELEGQSKKDTEEDPRGIKHVAIHILVKKELMVFSNVAAKKAVDLVVALPTREGKLNTAGVRIKTSSFRPKRGGWYFSQASAKFFIDKDPFFYIFCLEEKEKSQNTILSKPVFMVVSSTDLMGKVKKVKINNGNYGIDISEEQLVTDQFWISHRDEFDQIKEALKK